MAIARPKTFASGAALVWRRQRVVWWIFVVCLFLALVGVRGPVSRVGAVLNHSLAATPRLVQSFDISAIVELTELPSHPLEFGNHATMASPLIFTIFMLFVTGGILATYYRDERLTAGMFFEAGGYHFWRFVRLFIYFLIVMIPIAILAAIAGKIYNHIDERAISPLASVHFFEAAAVVILFLLMCARLWFDMAQVIAVTNDEYRMHRAIRLAARLVWRNFGSLFWLYLRISVVAWVGFGVALYVWMALLPPAAIWAAILLSQLMILYWIGTRLWQRASEVQWYREFQASVSSRAPVYAPEPLVPVGSAAPSAT